MRNLKSSISSHYDKTNDKLADILKDRDKIPEVDVDAESDNGSETTDDENDSPQNTDVNESHKGRPVDTTKLQCKYIWLNKNRIAKQSYWNKEFADQNELQVEIAIIFQ